MDIQVQLNKDKFVSGSMVSGSPSKKLSDIKDIVKLCFFKYSFLIDLSLYALL